MITVPKILYKYRDISIQNLNMLKNNQVWFSCPLDLNDPFDCVSSEHIFDDWREDSLGFLASLHPQIDPNAITREGTLKLINAINEHPEIEKIKNEHEILFQNYIQNLGIFCLSECNNSILMWSHYADNHKGYCIGYKNNFGLNPSLIRQVTYSTIRNNDFVLQYLSAIKMTPSDMYEKFLSDFILTKYIDWSYEKEWRIIGKNGINFYKKEHLHSIIFGLNMKNSDRELIQCVLQDRDICFYECIKSKRSFSVEVKQIS